jgi:hypothetical protein
MHPTDDERNVVEVPTDHAERLESDVAVVALLRDVDPVLRSGPVPVAVELPDHRELFAEKVRSAETTTAEVRDRPVAQRRRQPCVEQPDEPHPGLRGRAAPVRGQRQCSPNLAGVAPVAARSGILRQIPKTDDPCGGRHVDHDDRLAQVPRPTCLVEDRAQRRDAGDSVPDLHLLLTQPFPEHHGPRHPSDVTSRRDDERHRFWCRAVRCEPVEVPPLLSRRAAQPPTAPPAGNRIDASRMRCSTLAGVSAGT